MKCKIRRDEPTATQRRALRKEVTKEFDKHLDIYNYNVSMQVLYILRFYYGFGQKRLEEFADRMSEMQMSMDEMYELAESDTPFLCELKLRDSGIDVDKVMKKKSEREVENGKI